MTKIVQVSDLRERFDECIEAIKNGEPVALFEGSKMIGSLQPQESDEQRLERLERAGIITRGTGLPPDFLSRPPIDLGEGVVEQFLEDRRHDR